MENLPSRVHFGLGALREGALGGFWGCSWRPGAPWGSREVFQHYVGAAVGVDSTIENQPSRVHFGLGALREGALGGF